MRDGKSGQASNLFSAPAVVTQLLLFGFVTIPRSFLVSRAQNSNKITNYIKSTVKTFLSGTRVVLPEKRICLLWRTGRHQTQKGSTDHRKENPGK